MRKSLFVILTVLLATQMSACALLIGAAAGGAAGYEAAKHGYTVQSPIKKESSASQSQ